MRVEEYINKNRGNLRKKGVYKQRIAYANKQQKCKS